MLEDIANKVLKEIKDKKIIAIDGRCASGKTTLANKLSKTIDCSVIHMDEFFLRPSQRSIERLNEPGGNVDYERFIIEVINPLKDKKDFIYKAWDCHKEEFSEDIRINPNKLTIIEGSYSCHPIFNKYYDLSIFLDINYDTQLKRIKNRNGKDNLLMFKDKWIPLEEKYFEHFDIKDDCDLYFYVK